VPNRSNFADKEYERINSEITAGHLYVALFTALPNVPSSEQAKIKVKLAALLAESQYLRSVLADHPDPLSFLASRSSGNGDSELLRERREAEFEDRKRGHFQSKGINSGLLSFSDGELRQVPELANR